jgi:hypothetical protein
MTTIHRITGPAFAGYTAADIRKVRDQSLNYQLAADRDEDAAAIELLQESIDAAEAELTRRGEALYLDPEPWEGHPDIPVTDAELARLIAEDEAHR